MDLGKVSELLRSPDGIWRASHVQAVSYPEEGNDFCFEIEDESYWFRHRNACIIAIMRRFPPAGPVFDIGGGNGFVSQAIRAAEFEAIVVEPGPQGARNCVRRGLPQVVCATFADARFRPQSLPAVGMFDVLEHIEDDRGFLAELAQSLAPAAHLYVTVPAMNWLWSFDDVQAGHFRRYTLRTLQECMKSAGFETLFATYFFGPLVLPLLLIRTVPSALGLRGKKQLAVSVKEHRLPGGFAGRVLAGRLAKELAALEAGRPLRRGTSCLLVARKTVAPTLRQK